MTTFHAVRHDARTAYIAMSIADARDLLRALQSIDTTGMTDTDSACIHALASELDGIA